MTFHLGVIKDKKIAQDAKFLVDMLELFTKSFQEGHPKYYLAFCREFRVFHWTILISHILTGGKFSNFGTFPKKTIFRLIFLRKNINKYVLYLPKIILRICSSLQIQPVRETYRSGYQDRDKVIILPISFLASSEQKMKFPELDSMNNRS